MAFPTTSVIDSFEGTNDDSLTTYASGTWDAVTGINEMEIQSSAATASTAPSGNVTDASYGPDAEAYCTLNVDPANNESCFVGARMQNTGSGSTIDGYWAWYNEAPGPNDAIAVERLDGGSTTTLGSTVTLDLNDGDSFGIEIIGTTIKAFYNQGSGWTEALSRTDSTHSGTGQLFIYCDNTTVRMDEFGGGTVVVATGGPPLLTLLGVG